MFKKVSFSIFLIVFSAQFIAAQNNSQAEQILNDLLNTAKTSAIKTNFKLISEDKNNSQSTTGIFTLKGTKFTLDINEMKVWFDGKTQWSYSQQNNEVTVSEPTEKELSETNPLAILSSFKAKCSIQFSGKTKSAQNYCIEMTPKVKNKNISKIEVQINKSNGNLASIKTTTTSGASSLLTLNNFQKGLKVADNLFVFNQAKNKGVSINDLR